MLSNYEIEAGKRTAIYVRISTNQQKTDRQVVELMDFAERSRIEVKPEDVFIDIISGFKEGELVRLATDAGFLSSYPSSEYE